SQRHAEGLDRTIEIFVVERVFIVPHARGGIGDLAGKIGPAIGSRLGFDRIDRRSRPGCNRRAHSDGISRYRKSETRRAADVVPTIGGIVIHVALPWMALAPGIFIRG